MTFNASPKPASSPWGAVQTARELAAGIWLVSTASHGGILLSAERHAAMPDNMKSTAYSHGGWYEEDIDWSLVAVTFPEAFDADSVKVAHATVKNWHPNLA